jgi:hypothetical protein
VELVVNGESVDRQELDADGKMRDITFRPRIDRSSWVALRILPSSHTNPIWVTVGGRPVRDRRSAEWLLKAVDTCREQKVGRVRLEERGDFERAYNHARAEYRRLLAEAR